MANIKASASFADFVAKHEKWARLFLFDRGVDNALMAGRPGDSCWTTIIKEWTSTVQLAASVPHAFRDVGALTGSAMVLRALETAPECRVARPTLRCMRHYGTNTWRWRAKRDQLVAVLDILLVVFVSATASLMVWAIWCRSRVP